MRIKEGFVLREICGEHVVSGEGLRRVNFSKLIALNPSATYLWQELEGKEFTVDTMTDLLCSKYDVDRERAREDAEKLCNTLVENGVVE